MQPQEQTAQPTSGMFAPYTPPEIGEPLETLEEAGTFVLLKVAVRDGVATQFGPRDAVDLVVQTAEPGKTRLFSGFAAGLAGQAKRVEAGDLPAVVRIVQTPTGRGPTRSFELIAKTPAGADLAAIAKGQPVPMMPVGGGDEIPY